VNHRVVAIVNYDFEKSPHCYVMIQQFLASLVKNTSLEIIVFSTTPIESYFKQYQSRIRFYVEPECYTKPVENLDSKFHHPGHVGHNIYYKLFTLCKITSPFLYVDADSFIFEPLDELVSLTEGKPFAAIDQPNFAQNPNWPPFYLNGGVQIVNDPGILNWSALEAILHEETFRASIGGAEQALLYEYFQRRQYDYHSPGLDLTWNAPARYVFATKRDGQWRGYLGERPVRIMHYYGDYKPWKIGCPIFREFQACLS
jgi:lipopolysaccharide biosynthesis glycosyltransferase